jgi:hypothetical protein
MNTELKQMVQGYIECANWADDIEFNINNAKIAIQNCKSFYSRLSSKDKQDYLKVFDLDQLGHDLYLTSNEHGTGFWDRLELGKLKDKLTDITQKISLQELYI